MRKSIFAAAAIAAALPAVAMTGPAEAASGVRAGTLRCDVGGAVGFVIGSKREATCTFRSSNGRAERYVGSIDRWGVDLGVTKRSVMVWEVVAPSHRVARGSLAGKYAGVSASAAAGAGVGANALVGGNDNSFSLQPLSAEAQRGVNLAVGVAGLSLHPVARRG